jgi:uncharacterized membrane protein
MAESRRPPSLAPPPGRDSRRTAGLGQAPSREDRRRDVRLDQPREQSRLTLPRVDAEAFGQWSEAIARFMGTARFLVYMTVIIIAWIGWNTLAPRPTQFDPYTFTFLTLVLSLQASYAAPLILLAQNRQADRDRVSLEEDRRRAAAQKADTEYLAREIAALRIAVGEVATRDFVRSELLRLVEELDESAQRRQRAERKELRREVRKAARRGVSELGEPIDGGDADEPHDEVDGDVDVSHTGTHGGPRRART